MPLKDLSFLQIPFVQKVIAIIGGMIKRIAKNEIGIRAASIAYSGLFSIFPLLLFLVFLGSQFLESEEARTALNNTLSEVLPAASETVQQVAGSGHMILAILLMQLMFEMKKGSIVSRSRQRTSMAKKAIGQTH